MNREQHEQRVRASIEKLREFYTDASDIEIARRVLGYTSADQALDAKRVLAFAKSRRNFSTMDVANQFKVPLAQATAGVAILRMWHEIEPVRRGPAGTSTWRLASGPATRKSR